jgi:hypothetical protein
MFCSAIFSPFSPNSLLRSSARIDRSTPRSPMRAPTATVFLIILLPAFKAYSVSGTGTSPARCGLCLSAAS